LLRWKRNQALLRLESCYVRLEIENPLIVMCGVLDLKFWFVF